MNHLLRYVQLPVVFHFSFLISLSKHRPHTNFNSVDTFVVAVVTHKLGTCEILAKVYGEFYQGDHESGTPS